MKGKIILCSLLIGAFVLVSFSATTAAAKKIKMTLTKNEMVKIGSNIEIPEGVTVDTATAIFGSVFVAGEAREDVVSIGGNIYLKPTAKVGKDAVAIGGGIIKEEGAKVVGNITEVAMPSFVKALAVPPYIGTAAIVGLSILSLLIFIGFLALACLIAALFPTNIGYVAAAVEKHPWKMLGWGIIGMILVPLITLLLAISLIGIPFIPLYIILVGIALLVGYIALVQIIGKAILKAFKVYNKPMILEVLLGAVVIELICLIPILGWAIKILIATLGLGGVLITRLATKRA